MCLSVLHRIHTLLHGPGRITWENGRWCPLVVHYWADLQSVHGFRRYDNIHICKLIAYYTANAYSAEREMSASACPRSVPGYTTLVTFRVSRRPREMYCGHARLCVCLAVCLSLCLSAAACPHYCTDPDVTWGSGRGCPLVVHYWADLQSVHGMRCYGNVMEMSGRVQR